MAGRSIEHGARYGLTFRNSTSSAPAALNDHGFDLVACHKFIGRTQRLLQLSGILHISAQVFGFMANRWSGPSRLLSSVKCFRHTRTQRNRPRPWHAPVYGRRAPRPHQGITIHRFQDVQIDIFKVLQTGSVVVLHCMTKSLLILRAAWTAFCITQKWQRRSPRYRFPLGCHIFQRFDQSISPDQPYRQERIFQAYRLPQSYGEEK